MWCDATANATCALVVAALAVTCSSTEPNGPQLTRRMEGASLCQDEGSDVRAPATLGPTGHVDMFYAELLTTAEGELVGRYRLASELPQTGWAFVSSYILDLPHEHELGEYGKNATITLVTHIDSGATLPRFTYLASGDAGVGEETPASGRFPVGRQIRDNLAVIHWDLDELPPLPPTFNWSVTTSSQPDLPPGSPGGSSVMTDDCGIAPPYPGGVPFSASPAPLRSLGSTP